MTQRFHGHSNAREISVIAMLIFRTFAPTVHFRKFLVALNSLGQLHVVIWYHCRLSGFMRKWLLQCYEFLHKVSWCMLYESAWKTSNSLEPQLPGCRTRCMVGLHNFLLLDVHRLPSSSTFTNWRPLFRRLVECDALLTHGNCGLVIEYNTTCIVRSCSKF